MLHISLAYHKGSETFEGEIKENEGFEFMNV